MTREEAVSQFESGGFHAFKRDWIMGATIGVGILNTNDGESEIQRFSKLLYLFPINDQWGIHAPNILTETDYSRRYDFKRACDVARALLKCAYLPFTPESILIHHIRGEGGGYQLLEHVPTGAKKQLTKPIATGSEVLRKRHQALDELAFELALGITKAEQNAVGQPAKRPESK